MVGLKSHTLEYQRSHNVFVWTFLFPSVSKRACQQTNLRKLHIYLALWWPEWYIRLVILVHNSCMYLLSFCMFFFWKWLSVLLYMVSILNLQLNYECFCYEVWTKLYGTLWKLFQPLIFFSFINLMITEYCIYPEDTVMIWS
jgi:hypothetical protein